MNIVTALSLAVIAVCQVVKIYLKTRAGRQS